MKGRTEVKDIPDFVNREKELNQIKAILSGRPDLIYFVYDPINSGKTALLMKAFEELPEEYIVFYFNFRGLNIQKGNILPQSRLIQRAIKELL